MKFSEIFEFQKKSQIKAGNGTQAGTYPFFTSSPVLSKFLNESQFDGENLIFGTGGSASVHYADFSFSVSTDCLVARLKEQMKDEYETKYVYHFLSGNIHLLEKGFKGAGLKHISKTYIGEIEIPHVTLKEQRRIVEELDTASSLKLKRKQSLDMLNTYLDSVFFDMFGDPRQNSMKWDVYSLKEVTKKITDGTHQSPGFVESGIPFIFISNIVQNEIILTTKKFISEQSYRELTKSTPIEKFDILYTTVGSYGHPAIVKTDEKFCFQRHIAHIKPDQTKTNIYFLYGMLKTPFVKQQADERAKGVAQKTLNLGELSKIQVILPPMDIQNKYADIVAGVENTKQLMLSQSIELDNQFNAMLHKAFSTSL